METKERTKRGLFVVFEGIDHSGKTTQCGLLAARLEKMGKGILRLYFPDRSTETGREINAYLAMEQDKDDAVLHDLFCKNRWEKRDLIMNALAEGKWVVCDRYAYSGSAYSMAKGMSMHRSTVGDAGLPAPDVVVFLDASVETTSARKGFGAERYETKAFQCRVKAAFEELLEFYAEKTVDKERREDCVKRFDADNHQDILLEEILLDLQEVESRPYMTGPVQRLWARDLSSAP